MTGLPRFSWSTDNASQRDRVLRLLEDGRPHSTLEFTKLGVLRISARVFELRRQGWLISCDGAEGRFVYQLTGRLPAELMPPKRRSWKARALGAETKLRELGVVL